MHEWSLAFRLPLPAFGSCALAQVNVGPDGRSHWSAFAGADVQGDLALSG